MGPGHEPEDRTISAPTLTHRYELRGLIGHGGMAEVYRAFDVHLAREVAIKMMDPTLASDVDRQRFASEMRLLASLNHAHLVTLLDAGFDDEGNRPWLVMELVDGPSLAQRLAEGPLSPDEVARIGAGLASALAHVHANGIVHRDVKPANVLLTADGLPKLADFGIARMADDRSDLTGTGRTIGTASYLAPEQLSGTPVTGASDIYALGLVLLEALTGHRAYPGTPTEAAWARLHRRPLIPVSLGPRWVHLLDAMTSTDPAARPDATQVAAELGTLATGRRVVPPAPVALAATGPVVHDGSPDRTRWYLRSALAAAGATALLLLSAGVAQVVGSGPPEPSAAADTPAASRSAADLRKPQGVAPSTTPSAQPSTTAAPVEQAVQRPDRKAHHPARHHGKTKAKHRAKHPSHHGKGHGGHGKRHGKR